MIILFTTITTDIIHNTINSTNSAGISSVHVVLRGRRAVGEVKVRRQGFAALTMEGPAIDVP
jgi:hypothetical protein